MGYADIYAAWKADPERFWMEAAEAIDWVRTPTKALWDENAPSTSGSRTGWSTPATTRWTATSRPGAAAQVAIIYDSPVTGRQRAITYAELQDRVARLAGALGQGRARGRPRDHLHADGARGGDRDAGLRAARRGAFGRLRRLRGGMNSRRASTTRSRRRSSPPPAGSSRGGSCTTSRCWMPRIALAPHKPDACVILQREQPVAS